MLYGACEGYYQTPLSEEFTLGSIQPILEYACPVWCGGPIGKLVKLQESFCRRHHVTLPPVKKQFDYHTLMLITRLSQIRLPPI